MQRCLLLVVLLALCFVGFSSAYNEYQVLAKAQRALERAQKVLQMAYARAHENAQSFSCAPLNATQNVYDEIQIKIFHKRSQLFADVASTRMVASTKGATFYLQNVAQENGTLSGTLTNGTHCVDVDELLGKLMLQASNCSHSLHVVFSNNTPSLYMRIGQSMKPVVISKATRGMQFSVGKQPDRNLQVQICDGLVNTNANITLATTAYVSASNLLGYRWSATNSSLVIDQSNGTRFAIVQGMSGKGTVSLLALSGGFVSVNAEKQVVISYENGGNGASFYARAGNDATIRSIAVSFESIAHPGYFLRHQYHMVHLHSRKSTGAFAQESTWQINYD